MLIRTPTDLGAVIRERRKQLGIGQADLASQIGVSRQWVVAVERGHSRAELGLILRTLDTLNISLDARYQTGGVLAPAPGPDIDAIIAAARKGNHD